MERVDLLMLHNPEQLLEVHPVRPPANSQTRDAVTLTLACSIAPALGPGLLRIGREGVRSPGEGSTTRPYPILRRLFEHVGGAFQLSRPRVRGQARPGGQLWYSSSFSLKSAAIELSSHTHTHSEREERVGGDSVSIQPDRARGADPGRVCQGQGTRPHSIQQPTAQRRLRGQTPAHCHFPLPRWHAPDLGHATGRPR